jgi:peroxiredoxin
MPGLVELRKKYGKDGLIVLGVTFDTEDLTALDQVGSQQNINYPLLAFSEAESGAVREKLGVGSAMPVTIGIGRDGAIVDTQSRSMTPEELEGLAKTLLSK